MTQIMKNFILNFKFDHCLMLRSRRFHSLMFNNSYLYHTTPQNFLNSKNCLTSGIKLDNCPTNSGISKFSTSTPYRKEWISVTFEKSDGENVSVKGKKGDSLLDVVVNNNVELDGFGACEGTLSCSTCHVIFSEEEFAKIADPLTDEELDMLDLAYGLTDTSRLGCQVCLTKDLEGVVAKVPAEKADARNA